MEVAFPITLPSTNYLITFSEPGNNWGRVFNVLARSNKKFNLGITNFYETVIMSEAIIDVNILLKS